MESAHTDETREKIVIPLFDIVVYPNSRTKFQVNGQPENYCWPE